MKAIQIKQFGGVEALELNETAAQPVPASNQVLVEVHDNEELERAVKANAKIVGVNNRNLATFITDMTTTLRLRQMIPDDKIVVSESGIKTRDDVEKMLKAGVGAILVGETLMKSQDISAKLRELLGQS